MTPRDALAEVRGRLVAERRDRGLISQIDTDAALAALEAAMPDDAERALRIRNLIAEREFNTACANRELTQFGEWRWDHEAADREIEAAIARLLAPDGAGEVE